MVQLLTYGWLNNHVTWELLRDAEERELQTVYMCSVLKAITVILSGDTFPSYVDLSNYEQKSVDRRTGQQIVNDLISRL